MKLAIFIITWLLAGVVSIVSFWIVDMRNEEFDPSYFTFKRVLESVFTIVCGYFSLEILLIFIVFGILKKIFSKVKEILTLIKNVYLIQFNDYISTKTTGLNLTKFTKMVWKLANMKRREDNYGD